MLLIGIYIESYHHIKKQFIPLSSQISGTYDEISKTIKISLHYEREPFFSGVKDLIAVVGKNGSGKTTLLKAIDDIRNKNQICQGTLIFIEENNQIKTVEQETITPNILINNNQVFPETINYDIAPIYPVLDINFSSSFGVKIKQGFSEDIRARLANYLNFHIALDSNQKKLLPVIPSSSFTYLDYKPDFSFEIDSYKVLPENKKSSLQFRKSSQELNYIFTTRAKSYNKEDHYQYLQCQIHLEQVFKMKIDTPAKEEQRLNIYKSYKEGNQLSSTLPVNNNVWKEIKKEITEKDLWFNLSEKQDNRYEYNNNYPSLYYDCFYEFSSSGEKSLLLLMADIYAIIHNEHIPIIIIDEANRYLHPEWERNLIFYINNLLKIIAPQKAQIILTTHSPIILSDLKEDHVLYCSNKSSDNLQPRFYYKKENKTFAQEISTLLNDSFFISNPIGQFATEKINSLFEKINESSIKDENEFNIVADDFLRNKMKFDYNRKRASKV